MLHKILNLQANIQAKGKTSGEFAELALSLPGVNWDLK
jgi:hypothetical protein